MILNFKDDGDVHFCHRLKVYAHCDWLVMCVFATLLAPDVLEPKFLVSDLWPTKLDFNNRFDVNRKLEVLVILFFGFHIYLMMKALTWGTGGHALFGHRCRKQWKGFEAKSNWYVCDWFLAILRYHDRQTYDTYRKQCIDWKLETSCYCKLQTMSMTATAFRCFPDSLTTSRWPPLSSVKSSGA